MPKAGAAPKVKAAENALAKAEKAEGKARTERDRCAGAEASARTSVGEASAGIGRVEAALAQALETVAGATAALTATKDQLVGWLGEERRPTVVVRGARGRAHRRRTGGRGRGAERSRRHGRVSTRRRGSPKARCGVIATLANRLSGVWGRLEEDRDVPAEPEAVGSAFAAIREELVMRHERATAERDVAIARGDDASRARVEILRGVDLGPDDDFRRALAEAGVVHGAAGERVTELEERIASASELERKILELEARRDIAKRLAGDLQPSRFLGFLLEEERAELAELGSDHFSQLTDGGYRFTDDDRFDIVDLNAANTKRKADSLSGGETFLASLALALALAEMVARGGGRLDSFFLDEGFGSLDPEHLDLRHGRDRAIGLRERSTPGRPRQPCGRDARRDRGPHRPRQTCRDRRHDRSVRRRTRCVERRVGVCRSRSRTTRDGVRPKTYPIPTISLPWPTTACPKGRR